MKKLFALVGAILSVIYLVSPVDLIPGDLATGFGLIDDAAVIPILLGCLKILGFDASRLLGRRQKKKAQTKDAVAGGEVVDID